jgi:hypothetical protein
MPRIDDLSDAEFMKLQAEYGDGLPICPICTLEDVRHLILELVAGDAVSDVSAPSALRDPVSARGPALPSDRGRVGMADLNPTYVRAGAPSSPLSSSPPRCAEPSPCSAIVRHGGVGGA